MSFFQTTVTKKYANTLDKEVLKKAYANFKLHFHNVGIQENIRNSKEEQYQEGFFRDLFVNVLGYKLNPEPNYNLITENKNVTGSKKADGAIIINDNVCAVIELKGTDTTDLSKIELQAFGYKNNQVNCTYVITSNFEKLWLYIDNAIDHLEFNLFTLTEAEFELLYLCLSFEAINGNIPQKIKAESLSQEDTITKKLYKDYSLFKRELHQNLVELNPEYDALTLFKKSQKLLDRFLFLFFAEDRNLLPPNSVVQILEQWKKLYELDEYKPLYQRFKKYFTYLNEGHKGQKYDVFAYNGGLFKPDELLDSIKIDDDLLYRHTINLSTYDFESEVDVNILGHIFENSLNELDEIQAQLEGQTIEKAKTKRKKDGVFYTPKYITKYIVENTVGKLCIDKKAELLIEDSDYFYNKKRTKEVKAQLQEKLKKYRKWLLELTICDPACGSGAFLNQALDFLINEHKYLDELQAKLFGDALLLNDVSKNILENNLFGVDLNEESVEIAKLSLWLRTAQPNRKLNDLNNNIKCGNSLIDDTEIAGDKAFNWQLEFPQVFEKGGFDVIIGNPPYGILIDKELQNYYSKNFPLTSYKINLYVLFIERMFQIFEKGTVLFIIPKSLLFNTFYNDIRKWLINESEIDLIYTITEKVFDDAEVGGSLLIKFKITKKPNKENPIHLLNAEKINNFISQTGLIENKLPQNYFLTIQNNEIAISSNNTQSVITKLLSFNKIKDFYLLKNGLNPGNIKHILISDTKKSKNHKPIIWGKEISKYQISWSGQFINYDENIGNQITLDDIKSKEGMNKQDKIDFALRNSSLFETKKIVIRKTGDSLIASLDFENFYFDTLVHGIYLNDEEYSLEFLVVLINSKPATNIYRILHDIKGKVFAKISLDNLSFFPIPNCTEIDRNLLGNFAKKQVILKSSFNNSIEKFQRTIQRKFELIELSTKLENWYSITYKEFIAELAKKKVKLSLSDEAEWEEYFLAESQKALAIKAEIDNTDKEIDNMVYQLYELTEEEIKIVESV